MSVTIDHLTWRYQGADAPALSGVNLEIPRGQWVTITGPSGCGKSTLALALTGFIPHRYAGELTGSVTIDGVATETLSPQELAGWAGMAQQDPESQLCTLVVEDEVAFGPENLCLSPNEVFAGVDWALAAVGASHLRHRSLNTLSGGEKQRVAVAAILAMRPRLLILDEPTANLDPRGVSEVLEVIEKLRQEQGITVIVIEHRLAPLLPLTDRLIVMSEGRIVADGPPSRLGTLTSPPTTSLPSLPPVNRRETLLRTEGLTVWRGTRRVLDGVSLQLVKGELVAIMGDNGSGKTSLLSTLMGMVLPREGGIRWQEQDIAGWNVFRRAPCMGLTFQNPNHQIFEHTVEAEAMLAAKNLAMVPPSDTALQELLGPLGLASCRQRHPLTLSMGQKKRLCLASVLLYSPALLLLDEPAIGQDGLHWQHQEQLLRQYCRSGGAVLMVCHEPALACHCHRLVFLHEGRLVVDAPPPEAFRQLEALGFSSYLPSREVWSPAPA